jgi:hypothetical protein
MLVVLSKLTPLGLQRVRLWTFLLTGGEPALPPLRVTEGH